MLVAGEASGDLQAGALAEAIKELTPDADISGIGGRYLSASGARIFFDSSSWSAIGIFDAATKIIPVTDIFFKFCRILRKESPDVIVLIDCPAFNMQVASVAKKLGIPTVYFFPPSQWNRDHKRLKKIADRVTEIAVVFPFTQKAYKDAGIEVYYFGHPLLDLVKPNKTEAEIRKKYGIAKDKILVAVLPGSRTQEIRYILRTLLDTAKTMLVSVPDVHFLLPVATNAILPEVNKIVAEYKDIPITVDIGQTYNFMSASELLIITSGSATLEGACLLKPMIIVYKFSWLSWHLAKLLIKSPYAGLPNLLAGKYIVPEFLQGDATPEKIAEEAVKIISNPEKQQQMVGKLKQVVEALGSPQKGDTVVKKVAELVMDVIK